MSSSPEPEPGNQLEPVTASDPDPQDDPSSEVHSRLPAKLIAKAVRLRAEGATYQQIADILKRPMRTVADWLTKFEDTTELARKRLQASSLDAAEQWQKAIIEGAKRGRHEPARDLLVAAGVIDQQQTAGDRVVIHIGTPEQPIRIERPQVIDSAVVRTDEA